LKRKVFVGVDVKFNEDGSVTPLKIIWEDGRIFEIDKVIESMRAASIDAGGIGLRYTIMVNGKKTYLWFEDPRWFVEGKY